MSTYMQDVDRFLVSTSQINAEGIHVWPLNPAFPIDVVQHTLSGLRPFRMNRHDYFEFVYLGSGSLVWQVQESFVQENEGDLFVMAGPKYHRVTERSSQIAIVESMFFLPELLCSSSREGSDYINHFLAHGSSFCHLIPALSGVPEEVLRLIRLIAKELPAETDRARLCVKTYVKMILVLLMAHAGIPPRTAARGIREQSALTRMKPLFNFLESKYQSQVSPQDAAEIVHMSPSSFRRVFKQVTGQSFVEYLNQFRIAKAQELLSTTDMPITDIGLEVGFCDQSYFGMIFRRLTQTTPRHFRQQAIDCGGGRSASPLAHGMARKKRIAKDM